MRKTLIAALTALTALAVAAVAYAQQPAPTLDVTAKIAPSKAGTKTKPKSERLDLTIVNSKDSETSASQIEIRIPKTLVLSTKGLKTCSVSKLNSQGKASCPTGSLAGTGTANAVLNPHSDNPGPLVFNVTTFVAGKNQLAFFLEQQNDDGSINESGVAQALPAKISSITGNKVFGQKLVIKIPANLQQPVPGAYSALDRIENSLALKSGKNILLKSIGCPKSREHVIGVKVTYVPNPNPPASKTAQAQDGSGCTGKAL